MESEVVAGGKLPAPAGAALRAACGRPCRSAPLPAPAGAAPAVVGAKLRFGDVAPLHCRNCLRELSVAVGEGEVNFVRDARRLPGRGYATVRHRRNVFLIWHSYGHFSSAYF